LAGRLSLAQLVAAAVARDALARTVVAALDQFRGTGLRL
jgi:hypothetical protein